MRWCVRHSKLLLIAGLCAGVGWPRLAMAMEPWLPQMVAILLVLTAFRIGHRAAFGALSDLRWSLPAVLTLQMLLPLALIACFATLGFTGSPLALALVLACSAPTISGAPSLAIMLGQNPGRVMQLLILGTALFPLTILPVLAAFPTIADPATIMSAGARLLLTILGAAAVGFALRAILVPRPTPQQLQSMEGATVLFFAAIVIGLMSALGPTLRDAPLTALAWALSAFILSFGLQAVALASLRRSTLQHLAGPVALAAGNRNIALFLVSLPPDVMAPIMIFVACWQLPMYLTPIILPKLYRTDIAHA